MKEGVETRKASCWPVVCNVVMEGGNHEEIFRSFRVHHIPKKEGTPLTPWR